MAPPLSSEIKLTDTMSATLRNVSAGLGETSAAMRETQTQTARFEVELGNLVHSFAGLRQEKDGHWVLNLSEGLKSAKDAAVRLVEAMGDVLKIAGRAQDLDLAERLNLGDKKAASFRELADSFGNTRHDDDRIRRALLPLTRNLKDEVLLGQIATAASDIEALTGGGTPLEETADAFRKLVTKRELPAKVLEGVGLNENDVVVNLADLLHTSRAEAERRMKAGKIAGETLASVVLDELAKKQGGSLGAASLEAGKTLGASLQRLADLPENIVKQVANSGGIAELKGTIDNIITLAQDKSIVDGLTATVQLVATIGTGVLQLSKWFFDFGTWLGETLAMSWLGYGALFDWLKTLPGRVVDGAIGIGKSIVEGIATGITGAISTVTDAVSKVGESAISSLRDMLGIHSPSRVFRELGGYTAEGFALGIEDQAGRVARAQGIFGPGDIASAGGGGLALGGGVFAPHVEVNLYGAAGEDAGNSIALAVRTELRRAAAEFYLARGGAS